MFIQAASVQLQAGLHRDLHDWGPAWNKSIFTSASIFKKSEDIKMDMTLFGSVGKKKKRNKTFSGETCQTIPQLINE